MTTPQWKLLVDHVMAVPEGVYEHWNSTDGWDNDTPFGRQYGENLVSWCVIFDWDMYSDVGLAGIVPRTDNVSAFTDWARARGQWSEYPSVGAWVNFGNGAHTEIVVGFDADTVYTKGGNSVQAGSTDSGQGNGVWSHSTARRSSRVVGYFAPHFPDGACPPTADPSDPRGGPAVASYRWPGPDPAPSTPTPTEEDPLAAFTEADIRRFIREEVSSQPVRDAIAYAGAYFWDLILSGQPVPNNAWGDMPARIHSSIQQLNQAGITPDQIKAAVAEALAGGIQLTVTTKGA